MIQYATVDPGSLLVGRQRELAVLGTQFELAVRGHTRVALVAGEPGIGKTRLLEAFAARASQQGALVLHGGASEAEGMPPYLPFLEALGQYIRTAPPDVLHEQAGAVAPILATILPELALRLGDLPASYPLPPEQARLRLYEAVGAFVATIAAPHALVLILDDLQWADPASLDLLGYVVRHQPAARLLILGAYREGEVEHNARFGRALAELSRLRQLRSIPIGPLTEADVAALAANYLGAPLDPRAAQRLFIQSEGNPFFVEELLRGWLETGVLAHRGEGWRLENAVTSTLPPSIVAAVRQRLARLSPEVVELLRTAAIVGRTFDVALLAEVAGQDAERVEERLLPAAHARLIRADDVGAYTFSHDKIRECLYAEVTTLRRQRLHGFIGRALEMRSEPANAQRLAELAFHFAGSGDRARGAMYALRAAEQALHTYAAEEAMHHYQTAFALLDPASPQRGQALIGLGQAAMLADAEHEAVTSFEAAQAWFLQSGDDIAAAHAAHRLGLAWWRQEAIREARAALETALTLLADRPVMATVEVLVDLGTLLVVSLHQHAEGLRYVQRALELARQLGDPRLEASATRAMGTLLVRANDLPAGIALLERALALAAEIGNPIEAAECCAHLAQAYGWHNQLHHFDELTPRWLVFAQQCHDPYQLRHIYSHLAVLHAHRGGWTEAEQVLALAQAIVERLDSPEPLAFFHMARGVLAFDRGDYPLAEDYFAQAIALFRKIGPDALIWYLGMLGMAQAAQGKRQEALACMDELEALVERHPAGTMPTSEPLFYLAAMAAELGDRERAARIYPRLLVFHGQNHDFLVDRLLGILATLLSDWETAHTHLQAAEAIARREHLQPELGRTLVAQADLELAQGGRGSAARARQRLEQALALFQALDNDGETLRILERLGRLARPSDSSTCSPLPDDLTLREAEVLRLIAAGKSNQEIASQLVLSVRTVERHISNIYAKIGAEGKAARATATAYALRHGLTPSLNT